MVKGTIGFILSVLVVAVSGCGQKPVTPPPPIPVNLMEVKAQRVWYFDKYPATTQAVNQVNIYPEVQGYITGMFFKEGATVRKGQVLYEIDKRIYQAAYDQAAANLKVAEGNLAQAQQDADRYVYLNSQNAVAKQLYDHAVITLQNAKNSVAAANQAMKSADANLLYAVIRAPFDGTIGFSQVKVGNMVVPGQTLLNTISTDDPMCVDFLVNEKQLPRFELLDKQGTNPADSLFTITLSDNSNYAYTGKISIIDRAVNAQTGAIRIRLNFPNPEKLLRAGMSCTLNVHNMDTMPQVLIPAKAVIEQMGEYFVFVAKDTAMPQKTDGDKKLDSANVPTVNGIYAFQKKVHIGTTIGSNMVIKSGLREGEKIVVDGVQLLHDGNRVNPGTKAGTNKQEADNTTKK